MNARTPRTHKPAANVQHDQLSGVSTNEELLTGSTFPATAVISSYLRTSEEPREILKSVNARAKTVQAGDLDEIQSMLMSQAIALQAIFSDLACQAVKQTSLSNTQILTQLALKAQAGSRATLQALTDLKKPRQVAVFQQTNLAHNQQINNGLPGPELTSGSDSKPIKLFDRQEVENGS